MINLKPLECMQSETMPAQVESKDKLHLCSPGWELKVMLAFHQLAFSNALRSTDLLKAVTVSVTCSSTE